MTYATRDDVDLIWGEDNVCAWADRNNIVNADEIDERMTRILEEVDAEIDAELLNGPYAIPFAQPYPTRIVHLAARMAGIKLYDLPGLADTDDDSDVMKPHRDKVMVDLRRIKMGLDSLDNALAVARRHPGVVN